MTRAKEELLLLTGEEPSPFLRDLPGAFLRREHGPLSGPPMRANR